MEQQELLALYDELAALQKREEEIKHLLAENLDSEKKCVYVHTLKENPEMNYVGQAYQEFNTDMTTLCRWRNDGKGYYTCDSKFKQAITEYGWDAFEHRIIEFNIEEENATLREDYFIRLYNSVDNGFNSVYPIYTEEQKIKCLKQKNEDRRLKEEDKIKRKQGTQYDNDRDKLLQYQKDRYQDNKDDYLQYQKDRYHKLVEHLLAGEIEFMPKSKSHPIKIVETGEVFNSPTEAAWLLKLPTPNGQEIKRITNKSSKSYHGYHFVFI